jgi:hypothetical protein
MSLTKEQAAAINGAWREGLAKFNAIAREQVADTQANLNALTKYMRSQNIAVDDWVYSQIWFASIGDVADNLEKVVVKSRSEIEAERTRKDQADSKQKYRKPADPKAAQMTNIVDPLKAITDLLTGKRAEKVAPAEAPVNWPSLAADFENLPLDQQKLYRALSAKDMRTWLAKRAEIVRAEKAAAAADDARENAPLRDGV